MSYTITWASGALEDPSGSCEFDDDVPFHAAVAQVLVDTGPVHFQHIIEEMARANAAGVYIDPVAIIQALSLAIGVFAGDGSLQPASVSGLIHHLEPTLN